MARIPHSISEAMKHREKIMLQPVEYSRQDMWGYRSWTVFDTSLYSLINSTTAAWARGKNKARCAQHDMHNGPDHKAPDMYCHCGYFAYWEETYRYRPKPNDWDLDDSMFGPPRMFSNLDLHGTLTVSGVVRASGEVHMHEYGFRSEYAEIIALAPMPHYDIADEDIRKCKTCEPFGFLMPEILLTLSKAYNVPTFTKWSDLYREYPPTNKCEKQEWKY